MKTQVNLGVVQETLLIRILAGAKQFEQAEPIVINRKFSEIVEAINCNFDKLSNAIDSLIIFYLLREIIDNQFSSFLKRHSEGKAVEIGVALNSRFG